MKITVKEQEKQMFCLNLPTVLVINRLSAAILPAVLKTKGIEMTHQQLWGIYSVLREYRNCHPEWVLVEAYTAGGEYVKIEI